MLLKPILYWKHSCDARHLLTTFQSWAINFVRRDGNGVAYKLARMAVSQRLDQVWIESYPSCIAIVVIAE
jgi:hypothetical protein